MKSIVQMHLALIEEQVALNIQIMLNVINDIIDEIFAMFLLLL